ncbi:TetR family transcriptional regulator [Paraburkholderia sp. BL10I2N1]|nr:TetR family transcriptional regulator [Paraburkholderia sp. BL10I2N1]
MPTLASRSASSRRTQEERSHATQSRIIRSALRLLEKKGIQGANLQDIARGARVTLGALQHHFGSRHALMERLIDEVMAPLSDDSSVWPSPALPLEERAKAFVQAAWNSMYGAPSYVAAWSLFFGCKASPELFARIGAGRARNDPIFFDRFVEHFPEVAASYPNPRHCAGLVFASLRGMGVLNVFAVSPEEIDGQLEMLSWMIVQAGTPAKSGRATAREPAGKSRKRAA